MVSRKTLLRLRYGRTRFAGAIVRRAGTCQPKADPPWAETFLWARRDLNSHAVTSIGF